jgi:hypothetical protein
MSKYHIDNFGTINVSDKDFLASGGEANIYVKDKLAIKIYHNQSQMISLNKIKELNKIKDKNVLIPKDIVYENGSPVGYTTDYKISTQPLCKFYTNSFKIKNNVSHKDINDLVYSMQKTISNIHDADCLCVDLNDMNELVSKDFKKVFFIDVDSYQTPSFPATAIMESIRDKKVKGNNWTKESDWYSFAILAFQMWIGIHPYKGKHPDYKNSEWIKRMEDGVSVFDKKVSLPQSCNDLSVIPKSHLKWLQSIFIGNERICPPDMKDALSDKINVSFNYISESGDFLTTEIHSCLEYIKDVFSFYGVAYLIGENKIYKNSSELPLDISKYSKVIIGRTTGVTPVIACLSGEMASFYNYKGQLVGGIATHDIMERNGHIYTYHGDIFTENIFQVAGDNILHTTRKAGSIMNLSTEMFRGFVFQNILGKSYLTIPYKEGLCTNVAVKELDGYRVLDGKSESNICVVIAERKGKYSKFILTFNENFESYNLRIEEDIPYQDINFTVLNNGVCVLTNDNEVQIFKDKNIKSIPNPPFSTSNKLINISGVIHYIYDNKLMSAKVK